MVVQGRGRREGWPVLMKVTFDLDLYLLDVGGGVQAVVGWVHHGHVRAAVHVQHLLHAVDAAALAAGAEGGAGHRVVAAQAVHLAAGRLAILHHHKHNSHSDMSSTCSPHLFPISYGGNKFTLLPTF